MMKALTLHQPWASLIMIGAKRFETRGWQTSYRGVLAIHAGAELPAYALEFAHEFDGELAALGIHELERLPRGGVVGCVRLVACIATTSREAKRLTDRDRAWGNWDPGRFAWQLAGPAPYPKPVPARGKQGLWDWDPTEAEAEVKAAAREIERAGERARAGGAPIEEPRPRVGHTRGSQGSLL